MVQSGTHASHPTVFLNQPFAAPHQSALPVPKSRQACQLPLGGSQGEETMRLYHPTYSSIPSACGRITSAPTGCGGRAADGSTSSRPLQLVYTIQPGAVENPKLRADSIRPYRAGASRLGVQYRHRAGRAVPYGYNPRSVIVRRFRRPYGWQQRSYGAAALPEKRFHSFRPHPPGTPGNHPGKIPA